MNNAALVRLFPPPIDKFRNFFEPPNSRGRNEASPNSAAFRQEDRPSRFHWRLLNLFSCFDKRVTERLDHLLGDIMADLSMQAPRGAFRAAGQLSPLAVPVHRKRSSEISGIRR